MGKSQFPFTPVGPSFTARVPKIKVYCERKLFFEYSPFFLSLSLYVQQKCTYIKYICSIGTIFNFALFVVLTIITGARLEIGSGRKLKITRGPWRPESAWGNEVHEQTCSERLWNSTPSLITTFYFGKP